MGYKEKDDILGEDSFEAFNEVLEVAANQHVDFVLLGGDLFHEHTPSQSAYYKCSKIFNKHVFGDAAVNASPLGNTQMSQGPRQKFQTYNFPKANYLSNKHKIKLPVFSIHGNHDDPVGLEMLSSLDQLNVNSYVNHFGKVVDMENIHVQPILFKKGRGE